MDVLSDVLKIVRMSGGGFLTAEFTAPWSIFSPSADELASLMSTRAENIALFHIIVEGHCWITLNEHDPVQLTAGSAIIFPHSPSHKLASSPHLTPEPVVPLLTFSDDKELPAIKHGGKGKSTKLVCGFLKCEQQFNPLIEALPALIIVAPKNKSKESSSLPDTLPIIYMNEDDWLYNTLTHTVEEALGNRPGCSTMLARLNELSYIEVLRRYIQQHAMETGNWFSALNDIEVGRALRLLHASPAKKWTVKELAKSVGRSRSVLAERFTRLVGESPIQYLTKWRMQIAKNLIIKADLSFLQIAETVGYESQAAFSRAFKRNIGVPPATWRKTTLQQNK